MSREADREWSSRYNALQKERDQLRADLIAANRLVDEAQARSAAYDRDRAELTAKLAAAQRTITQLGEDVKEWQRCSEHHRAGMIDRDREIDQLREDAARVQGRLDEAAALIARFESEYLAGAKRLELLDDYRAFLRGLASGSSTGEVLNAPVCADCGHCHSGDRCHWQTCGCDRFEPAAPEPAPAPCTVAPACIGLVGHGPNMRCPGAAVPASAQGTTERCIGEPVTRGQFLILQSLIRELQRDGLALDKRVAALATWVSIDDGGAPLGQSVRSIAGDVAELMAYHQERPSPAPHQPAPVERHAFVACDCPGCAGERCAKEPPGGGPACGQPRGAAVHDVPK